MHKMESKSRIITIIGLVFEGIAALTIALTGYLFAYIDTFPGLRSAAEADMSVEEYTDLLKLFDIFTSFFVVMAIILGVMFIINLYLLIKLLTGKYNDEQAKKVYLYQAIWGGISLLFNQVTGILYLISGVQGYSGRKETTDIREGI